MSGRCRREQTGGRQQVHVDPGSACDVTTSELLQAASIRLCRSGGSQWQLARQKPMAVRIGSSALSAFGRALASGPG